ncbi:MAG: hypothetical protein KAV82_15915 [Phycisphaerae bacterium]|nr:hypothetical protein [Phycisphaerae bacterium]
MGLKRGFMLMEVVLAVGLLVVGMAFVGMQIQNSSRSSRRAERSMRALLLAESKLSELDAGLIIPEEEIEEDFGHLFPNYAWRMRIEPTSRPDLNLITLEILYDVRMKLEDEFDFDETDVVHRLYTMRATPTTLDLTRDFGMGEEAADKLAETLSSVGEEGIDPRNLNPALFASLDLEELLEVAPPLLEAFGISMSDLMQVLPDELRQALEEAQAGEEDSADEGGGEGGGEGERVENGESGENVESGQGSTGGGRRLPGGRKGGGRPRRGGGPTR